MLVCDEARSFYTHIPDLLFFLSFFLSLIRPSMDYKPSYGKRMQRYSANGPCCRRPTRMHLLVCVCIHIFARWEGEGEDGGGGV